MIEPRHAARPGQHFENYASFFENSAYADFRQEHRGGGSFGANLIDVEHDAIDLIDPPIPEYVFNCQLTEIDHVGFDYGDGLRLHGDTRAATFNVVPPSVEVRFLLSHRLHVRFLTLPACIVDPILDQAKLTRHAFSHHYCGGIEYTPRPKLAALINQLWRASTVEAPGGKLYFDGLILQFLAETTMSDALSPTSPERPEDARIARAIDYAEAHLGEALTLEALANIACLSAGHFSRSFKATVGEPVWAYVQRRRGERAMDMLQYTDLPISEIAYRCGFAHQGHLTACFKRQFGLTPGAARAS
ncbi:MAG: AraC family transcriptional regulator [Pseudomonadota bacterium]